MSRRPPHFQPTHLIQVGDSVDTGMGTTEVVTDVGPGYIKVMGNRQGPHNLACEWVGTQLADWFGLSVADYSLMTLGESDSFPLPRGNAATPGPAFITRSIAGDTWQKTPQELLNLVNPEDITRIVIFDNWTLNCDRWPPPALGRKPNYDNVYLSIEGLMAGQYRLVAIDHNNCFACGRDLTDRMASIDWVQKADVYGLFPAFQPHLEVGVAHNCVARLREMTLEFATEIVGSIPPEWQVPNGARMALAELIYRRAAWVADNILGMLGFLPAP